MLRRNTYFPRMGVSLLSSVVDDVCKVHSVGRHITMAQHSDTCIVTRIVLPVLATQPIPTA